MEIGFIVKKILSALLMPLSIGLTLGAIGLWFLYKNSYKKAKIFLTLSFIWIVTISYSPIATSFLKPLEVKYSKLQKIPKDVKYILLLGGDRNNRAWEALRLYHKMSDVKIITSGYAGRTNISEAIKTANLLNEVGVAKKDIIIHSKPKDTKEEAIEIKQLLGDIPFILITSFYHMPRAIQLFKKEGLNPIPAPTDSKNEDGYFMLSVPNSNNLEKTEIAWHEYLGMFWNKIRGY